MVTPGVRTLCGQLLPLLPYPMITELASCRLQTGPGRVLVNHKPLSEYCSFMRRAEVLSPFAVLDQLGTFDMYATVKGGGVTGQAQALRHGVAKALQAFEPEWRWPLKAEGLMTRDPRVVERKKAGRAKARKAFQWVKR